MTELQSPRDRLRAIRAGRVSQLLDPNPTDGLPPTSPPRLMLNGKPVATGAAFDAAVSAAHGQKLNHATRAMALKSIARSAHQPSAPTSSNTESDRPHSKFKRPASNGTGDLLKLAAQSGGSIHSAEAMKTIRTQSPTPPLNPIAPDSTPHSSSRWMPLDNQRRPHTDRPLDTYVSTARPKNAKAAPRKETGGSTPLGDEGVDSISEDTARIQKAIAEIDSNLTMTRAPAYLRESMVRDRILELVEEGEISQANGEQFLNNRMADQYGEKYRRVVADRRNSVGQSMSADFLERYLDGSGGSVWLDPPFLLKFGEAQRALYRLQDNVSAGLTREPDDIDDTNERALVEQILRLKEGEVSVGSTYWDAHLFDNSWPEDALNAAGATVSSPTAFSDADLQYALGQANLNANTFLTFKRQGDRILVTGVVLIGLGKREAPSERYDFDANDWFPLPKMQAAIGEELLHLEKHRGAQPFEIFSEWSYSVSGYLIVGEDNLKLEAPFEWNLDPPVPPKSGSDAYPPSS